MENHIKKDDFYAKTSHINTLFRFLKNHKEKEFIEYISSYKPNEIDVNMKDDSGNYLIYFAVISNRINVLKKLFEYGARTDVLDSDGKTILYYPIRFDFPEIIDILLELDKKNFGVSMVNLKDSKENIPIFYSLKFRNHYALQELLKNGADVNYKNSEGCNSLHNAVLKKDPIMVRMVIKYIRNIDLKTMSGDTALGLATNYQLTDIVKILIENGASVNTIELDNDFTPIFFAVLQNNIEITKILLQARSNPNHQDSRGNTILHYAISGNNHVIIDMIFNNYQINENKKIVMTENTNDTIEENNNLIDPNIINIDGLNTTHLLIYNYKVDYDPYIIKLLPYVNINYQDNSGNTVLHLIVEKDLWKKFESLLIFKKLSIYIKNNDGISVLDMVPLIDKDKFIKMVIVSYFNYLKTYNNWNIEWQKKCRTEKVDDMILSIDSSKPNDCYKYIYDSIINKKLAFPVKDNTTKIIIEPNEVVNFTTFTGSPIDTLVSFKYLTNLYPNAISLYDMTKNDTSDLEKYYLSIGIEITNYQKIFQFEILWVYQRIFFPSGFEMMITNIIKSKKHRYIIIPIGITLASGSHSGCIIYDIEKMIMERFEPHGSHYPYNFNYNPDLFDEILYKKFNTILNNSYGYIIKLTYYRPKNYLPKIGFQMFENIELNNKNIGDPSGFCTLWCVWYLDHRLRYTDVNPKKLTKNLIKQIKINNLSFKEVIRNYSKRITDLRDSYLKKIGYNINDYMNDKISPTDINKLIDLIIK